MLDLPDLRPVAISVTNVALTGTFIPISFVVTNNGLSDADALSTIRFSLGRFTTDEEVDAAASMVIEAYVRITRSSTAAPSPA